MSNSNKASAGGMIGAFFMMFVLAFICLGGVAWYYINQKIDTVTDPVSKLKTVLEKITKQEVIQQGHSLEIQTNRIQELAVIEREMHSIIKYETVFLGARKTLILRGRFNVKAGFDLTKASKFSIMNGRVIGTPPPAEILTVELEDFEIYHSSDQAFNKLTAIDQEAATNQLLYQARKDAQASDLRELADQQFEQRLDDLMDSNLM